jgi:L-ascorbate metabolism protein UlaG (beta-lactamase superfamily)
MAECMLSIKNRGDEVMKIKWYGHAAFLLTTDAGTRIIIDPYQSGAFDGALSYGRITDEADLVLISHDHDDHNYTADIRGDFRIVKEEGTFEGAGVTVRAVAGYHDTSKGAERGENRMFVVEADGLRVAHLGDLGHELDGKTLGQIGKVDVLLVPTGGFFTIDAAAASKVMDAVAPALTIPMHFKTEKCDFPIAPVEEFARGRSNVRRKEVSEIEISKASLPGNPEIVVLRHAL